MHFHARFLTKCSTHYHGDLGLQISVDFQPDGSISFVGEGWRMLLPKSRNIFQLHPAIQIALSDAI